MKWFRDLFVNFILRMLVGIMVIYVVNQFLITKNIDLSVVINPVTMATAGVFGLPGVGLLYGIIFFQ